MMRVAKIVAVIQLFFRVALAGGGFYLLWLTRTAEMRNARDAEMAIHGLYIAAALFLPLGLLVLIGGAAMWKGKLWGWWLAMITDASLMLVFVYSLIDDGLKRADSDDIAATVLSIIPVILLLLPAVRKSYWRKSPPKAEIAAAQPD
jgi:uncharacterized membrane protein (DUF2068 family)